MALDPNNKIIRLGNLATFHEGVVSAVEGAKSEAINAIPVAMDVVDIDSIWNDVMNEQKVNDED